MIRGSNEDIIQKLENYKNLIVKYEAYSMLYDQLFPRTTPTISNEPKAHSDLCELERVVHQRLEVREMMAKLLEGMHGEIKEVVDLISKLPEPEDVVLLKHYILGQTYEQIAEGLHCSESTVHRIRARALERLMI